MNMKYLILIILFSGCLFQKSFFYLPEGGVRPKNPDFKLAKEPFSLKDTTLIDTNAIYLERLTDTYLVNFDQYNTVFPNENRLKPIKQDTSYHFYRFFRNGRVYVSRVLDHFPSVEEMNNYNLGLVGYYRLEGNQIITEIFTPSGNGKYLMKYGTVKNDTIFLVKKITMFFLV
ncbi:MAG: hypothetical protein GF313_11375 [Caldithrix sp.]|nr:hypothetical protein [Caldithrix sp.]